MAQDSEDADLSRALTEIINGEWFRHDFYPSALAPAVRELGEALAQVTSAAHILSVPFYALGLAGKRTNAFLRRVLEPVPPDMRVKADPQYTAEVLEAARCREDGSLRDMFAQLLRTAIDKRSCSNAHPAFPKLLAQLCADEAEVLLWLARHNEIEYTTRTNVRMSGHTRAPKPDDNFPGQLSQPMMLEMYIDHFITLGLAESNSRPHAINDPVAIAWAPRVLKPTNFGQLFMEACLTYEQAREYE